MQSINKTAHQFHKSLKIGKDAETLWLNLMTTKHPEYKIKQTDGRNHDFIIESPFGSFTVELKSDSYDMEKTANVFMERYSNWDKRSPGGPWQAASKGIDLYTYWFVQNKIMLTFPVNKLILALEAMQLDERKLIPIVNRGFITKGYKIERVQLIDIMTICDLNTVEGVQNAPA